MLSARIDYAIDRVQAIRAKNNKLWIDILRLSFEYAPDKTNALMEKINANDKKISKLLGDIK